MAEPITYQEVANAIAAILHRHPQFDRVFTEFERLPWMSIPRGMIKRMPEGGSMIAERDKTTGKIKIIFNVGMGVGD